MLAYLIQSEENQRFERDENKQKDLLFAVNPELYFKIWPDQTGGISPEEEEEIDWVVPETEADVQTMMAELRKAGWSG